MKNSITPRRSAKTPEKVISDAKKLWLKGVPATEISRQLAVEVKANTIRRWAKRYDWHQPTGEELAQERLDKARVANGKWLDIESRVAGIMRDYANKLTDSIQESDEAEYTKLSEMMEHVFKLSELTREVGTVHERLLNRASEAAEPDAAAANRLDDKLRITNETLEQITKAILVAEFGGTEDERISEAQPVMLAAGEPVDEESTPGNQETEDIPSDDKI
ncbi:MAG: hypothetical protein OXN17_10880 [Candidatus Poribacteria bacterium]|nr:hypothetical protein [Candidatus Poribacteria bacterium]MDE0503306.1 hypothetical protein [Candidatus Poribacteria bacterium]